MSVVCELLFVVVVLKVVNMCFERREKPGKLWIKTTSWSNIAPRVLHFSALVGGDISSVSVTKININTPPCVRGTEKRRAPAQNLIHSSTS